MSPSYPLMDLEGKCVLGHKGNSLSCGLISFLLLQDTHERHLLLSRVLLGVSHSQQFYVAVGWSQVGAVYVLCISQGISKDQHAIKTQSNMSGWGRYLQGME